MEEKYIIQKVKQYSNYEKNKGYVISPINLERLAEDVVKNNAVSPHVSPCLFYVVAPSEYEEGNLEQITNGLTYKRAVDYRDGDFCKNRWPNAYILASLNES